ncbi:MAG TPA: ABC transporter substrate-binding protein [Candidatus Binatia bacterium]|nr:ABC transporter substrate-binding protein [Candidatus Binatia bacterium]
MRLRNALTAVLFLIVGARLPAAAPLFAADRIRLALPAKSMGYLPLFVAVHRGFFKDEGIDIEITMMLPQLAHNALLSGEVDFHGVADSALRLAARGAPLKSVFFGAMRPNYFLMAKPHIKSVSDLRGKYIGMVRFGDTIELASRIALQREGLDLQKDAVPILIGLPSTRVAALTAGSIDATIVVPPDNVLLKQKGFRELLFLGDALEFPSNGYATSERQLAEKRELSKRTLRALYRGLMFARERADDSIQIIEREWKVDNTVAREAYASLAKSFSRDGSASDSGLRFHMQQIQSSEKSKGDVPLSKIVDFRLLEEIRREAQKY